jgi:hypothetical protein
LYAFDQLRPLAAGLLDAIRQLDRGSAGKWWCVRKKHERNGTDPSFRIDEDEIGLH